MTIVDGPRPVTGGVDTHLDLNVAAAVDGIGGLLGVESFPTSRDGHARLYGWLCGRGRPVRVGVEGAGSYGAGIARFLAAQGVEVVEVDRPNRRPAARPASPTRRTRSRRRAPRCRGAPRANPRAGTATSRRSGRWSSLAAPLGTPRSRR